MNLLTAETREKNHSAVSKRNRCCGGFSWQSCRSCCRSLWPLAAIKAPNAQRGCGQGEPSSVLHVCSARPGENKPEKSNRGTRNRLRKWHLGFRAHHFPTAFSSGREKVTYRCASDSCFWGAFQSLGKCLWALPCQTKV